MFVEAGFLGFVPLMLLCFNILACFQEASLVSQVIPRIEGSYYKALLYTGIALGAGIMFAPNFVWWRQLRKEIATVKASPILLGNFQKDYLSNLEGGRNKHLAIWILCISTSILTHGLTLFFCTIAFQNPEVLKSLSMKGMEDVSIAFCVVVTGSCFFLDILLGVFTNAQVDLDSYKPDNSRDLQMLKDAESYNKMEKAQLETREKLLEEARVNQEKANILKKNEADLNKLKKDGTVPSGSNNTNSNNSNNSTNNPASNPAQPGKDVPKSSSGKAIYDITDVDEFYGVLFNNRGLDKEKIAKAIKSANQQKFEKEIGPVLSSSMSAIRTLYKNKAQEEDLNKRITIMGKVEEEMKKVEAQLKAMGLQPRKS
jgi:hypothetical protein